MNEALNDQTQRWPVFASAALLLPIAAILFLLLQPSTAQTSTPPGGPQLGIIFLFIRPALILFGSGLVCTFVALLRRERPTWLREAALILYGLPALAAIALLVVRFATSNSQ